MPKYTGPLPGSDFARQVAGVNLPPFRGTISGEVVAASGGYFTLGVANIRGKIVRVVASVSTAGKAASQVPTGTFDVRINGTTALSNNPVIAHVSGEAAQHKTTWSEAGDTGITKAVVNNAACDFGVGDILSWNFAYTGSDSPTAKMANPSIVVETDPIPPV